MCPQSWFLILGDKLKKHVRELCCCTKCTLPGLWGGEASFPGVGRELLHVVLETSLSLWRSTARQSKCRGPEWERFVRSAISKWRGTGAFPREMAVLEQCEALGLLLMWYSSHSAHSSSSGLLMLFWYCPPCTAISAFGTRKLENAVRTKHCRKTWAKFGS